ncbi:hypothetical protein BDBG_17626 [Blastomyces gilchristii SLH14081]|uniref:Uncharacterized protein n=1 Tax=Blastomyces gilchristii (strain SLH14081) TaxID=559298 RepID=A0A179UVP4_BLAGS|nr:uncharacterized protein BDBG_17626 [Blastomyces gilchristii SLH14081]OAT12124.1 hypothetical protein BDBG_17626 [Blastomyces gilchristii SLH14081]
MYPVNHNIILNQLRSLTIDDAPDLNIYNGDDDVYNHFISSPADQLSTVFLQLTFSEMIVKLYHQINAAVKILEDVKNILTSDLIRQLNKIFKSSMI